MNSNINSVHPLDNATNSSQSQYSDGTELSSPHGKLGEKKVIIENSDAGKTYKLNGQAVTKGNLTTRLQLSKAGDTKFNIAVKTISEDNNTVVSSFKNIFKKMNHVYLQDQEGQSIYVNVNSLATRLHLSKNEIYQAVADGKLTELINDRMKHQDEIIENYSAVLNNYKNEAKLKKVTGINKKTLMKIVMTSIPELESETGTKVTIKSNEYVIFKKSNDDESPGSVTLIKIGIKLGHGSFGYVHTALELNRGMTLAYKKARVDLKTNEDILNAQESIKTEYEILKEMHKHNEVKRLQEAPMYFVKISGKDDAYPEMGYIGKNYKNGDLIKSFSNPLRLRTKQAEQILEGIVNMDKLGKHHGDIKPENFLVDDNNDVFIADLADAQSYPTSVDQLNKDRCAAHTPFYTSFLCKSNAKKAMKMALDPANTQQKDKWLEDYIFWLRRGEVFSAGITIYELLSGEKKGVEFKDQRYAGGYLNESKINIDGQALFNKGVLLDRISLIKMMINVKKHPSLSIIQALDQY